MRQSRPVLSTVVSSGSDAYASPAGQRSIDENAYPEAAHYRNASRSTDSLPSPRIMRERAPLSSSDLASLNCLQETVSPRALLNSRFISAPLVEAKIRLPASNGDLAASQKDEWNGRSFGISRNWTEMNKDEPMRAPFDSRGVVSKDPTLRWSVDF